MPATLPFPSRLGRYEVVGRIAMGGMAELLLARLAGPSGFERAVAIKRILPHLAQHPSFVQMFLDEGRLVARIGHPNVVQVQELHQDGDELYLVMEYLQGESLAGVLRRLHARARRLDPAVGAYAVAAAAAGLQAAHELRGPGGQLVGLVHRDVSPQNLFVGYDGTVKVLDFGIAKTAGQVSQTEQGTVRGKLEYMSPEQARGEPLDRRSDVFALGAVLYEVLTQRRLFRRSTPVATWNAVCVERIAAPREVQPEVPAELEAICLRALDRDLTRRYGSALELRRALLEWVRQTPQGAVPEEGLSQLMASLFSDRISDKGRVVETLKVGGALGELPPGEADLAVELPSVVAEVRGQAETRAVAPRRARWPAAVAAALLTAGVVAAGVVWWPSRAEAPVVAPAAAAPVAEAVTPPPAPELARVSIFVDSVPQGARVMLGGVQRGATPVTVELERSTEATKLRLEHKGHEPIEEAVTPDVSLRLRYSLKAVAPARLARPKPLPAAAPPKPASPKPQEEEQPKFRRFN